MRRLLCALAFCLLASSQAFAQTGTVAFALSNVVSAAQAQGFTYRLKTTAPGATTPTVVVLTSVTCTGTGTAPITAACSAPLPTAAAGAHVTGASTVVTAALSPTDAEGPASAPFVPGPGAPTGLSITQ